MLQTAVAVNAQGTIARISVENFRKAMWIELDRVGAHDASGAVQTFPVLVQTVVVASDVFSTLGGIDSSILVPVDAANVRQNPSVQAMYSGFAPEVMVPTRIYRTV